MRHLVAALVLALTVGVMPACSQSKQNASDKAPTFSLPTADGKTFDLAKQKGKVVVINLWATWCGPCRMEIPGFQQVYGKYRNQGLEIVGVSLDQEGWDVVKPYVARANITYPVVIGDGYLANAYGGIQAIPSTFFVDKDGKIRDRHVGYLSVEQFEKKVKALL